MTTEGRDSARIVLVGRRADGPADAAAPRPRDGAPASGWTVRRLVNGASLGGIATVLGGLVFQKNFQLLGDNNPLLLAMGFGLFVVGMIVFTLCLIGLSAVAVRSLVATRGWSAAVLAGVAASAPLVLLGAAGVVPLAFPALIVLMVTGGYVLALKR